MRTRERLANVHGLTVARAAGTPGAFGSQRRYPPQPKPAPVTDVRRREGARRRAAARDEWVYVAPEPLTADVSAELQALFGEGRR